MTEPKLRLFISEVTKWEVAAILFLSIAMAVGTGMYVGQQGKLDRQSKTIEMLRRDNWDLKIKQTKIELEIATNKVLIDSSKIKITALEKCIETQCTSLPLVSDTP